MSAPRKYLSGSKKRKKKIEEKEEKRKLTKLTTFFSSGSGSSKATETIEIDEVDEDGKSQPSKLEKNFIIIDKATEQVNVISLTPSSINPKEDNKLDENQISINFKLNTSEPPQEDFQIQILESPNPDVGLWPNILTDNFVETCVSKGPDFFQNRTKGKYELSKRVYVDKKRHLSDRLFERKMLNGEINKRHWLLYSPSCGQVFCFVCKLFGKSLSSTFINPGFNDWKKAEEKTSQHENSVEHRNVMVTWLARVNKRNSVNRDLAEQFSKEVNYWQDVLRRIVSVIKFLSERGLPFRGDSEILGSPENGNYLGTLELISQFDPVLENHIKVYGGKGKGNPSYLSSTICDEVIILMAKKVEECIIQELTSAKYYSLIIDSTPDITHIDQLAIIVRYCKQNDSDSELKERFLGYVAITSHTGISLYETITYFLHHRGINLMDCRGQSYDNASNMSGKFEGLQAQIKKQNSMALYIPCAGHSLNLVGMKAVDTCVEAVDFFGLLQSIYVFFANSPRRWNILTSNLNNEEAKNMLKLKSLSGTRWSAHAEAVKALSKNYKIVIKVFEEVTVSESENGETKRTARSLGKKMKKRESALMCILWGKILERFNATSKTLQSPQIDIQIAVDLLESLKSYLLTLKDDLHVLEEEMVENFGDLIYDQFRDEMRRPNPNVKKFPDGKADLYLTGVDKFRVEVFFVICDRLIAELHYRLSAYKDVCDLFSFLTKIQTGVKDLNSTETQIQLEKLIQTYPDDIEETIKQEWPQFVEFIKKSNMTSKDPLSLYTFLINGSLIDVFPNISIAIRIYLTIPVSNCSAERSFSKLKLIKNRLRSTLSEAKLNPLTMLSIESDLTRKLSFEDTLKDFATSKARKKPF